MRELNGKMSSALVLIPIGHNLTNQRQWSRAGATTRVWREAPAHVWDSRRITFSIKGTELEIRPLDYTHHCQRSVFVNLLDI